jgi:hypothetical protein
MCCTKRPTRARKIQLTRYQLARCSTSCWRHVVQRGSKGNMKVQALGTERPAQPGLRYYVAFTCPRTPRSDARQGTKLRNREAPEPQPLSSSRLSLQHDTSLDTLPEHSRPGHTPGAYYRHPIIFTSPSMGCASPSTTASLFSAAQLTPVGPAFPYSASAAGLNKTDASFASLVRQVGDGGPP